MKKLQKQQKGFTIIEVLIVLAIAGLIMLIVFLAVPALQRNSRNTQRKNDVSSIIGAVSEWSNNNNGTLPAASGQFSTVFTNVNPNLGSYQTPANVQYVRSAAAHVQANPNNLDRVTITNFSKCANNASTALGATTRSIIVLFTVEGSGGTLVPQCQET